MAMLGHGALAMWWDMAPAMREEFEDWHSHEHFPERLSVPGFLRGSRWASADGGEGFFVLYEVAEFASLTSPEYLARLNAPTPWSTKLMPHHRNMVRSQCRVVHSVGGAVAAHAITLRFGAGERSEEELRGALAGACTQPGISGAHLLHTHTPAIPATAEQRIRGNADRAADRIVVLCGYEAGALVALCESELLPVLSPDVTGQQVTVGRYRLALSMVRGDAIA
jgi:hypothetical protein